MLPFSSRCSSTLLISNCAYLASRTPSAIFSKSQYSAMLRLPAWVVAGFSMACLGEISVELLDRESEGRARAPCAGHAPAGSRHYTDLRPQADRMRLNVLGSGEHRNPDTLPARIFSKVPESDAVNASGAGVILLAPSSEFWGSPYRLPFFFPPHPWSTHRRWRFLLL